MNNFKKTIYIHAGKYKHYEKNAGDFHVTLVDVDISGLESNDYVVVGSIDVEVELPDSATLEALHTQGRTAQIDKEIENLNAKYTVALNRLKDEKQTLLALGHDEDKEKN